MLTPEENEAVKALTGAFYGAQVFDTPKEAVMFEPTQFDFAVSGAPPITNPNLSDQTFIPDRIVITFEAGKIFRAMVSGPTVGPNGKPYKTKRSFIDYEESPQPDYPTPDWVQHLMSEYSTERG